MDSPEKILPYKVSGSRLRVRIQLPPAASLAFSLLLPEPLKIAALVRVLCQPKGTGERISADYQSDFRQFLSVGRRATSLQTISVIFRPSALHPFRLIRQTSMALDRRSEVEDLPNRDRPAPAPPHRRAQRCSVRNWCAEKQPG